MAAIIGDVANLYRGPGGMLKLARDPADNDLIRREAAALRWLACHGDPEYLPYVPSLLSTGSVSTRGSSPPRGYGGRGAPHAGGAGGSSPRSDCLRGNALGTLDGFCDLAFVASRFPAGLDPRDVAWIWRRLLVALGFAHRAGIVHGAVLPPHVLIEPEDHGLTLVDWCYATGGPQPGALPAIPARYRDWYPPEVRGCYIPGPDLDIYLGTRCMLRLLADRTVPGPLAAFAAGCLIANPRRRPDDAWALLHELDEVLERLYGPRRFRPFPPLD